MKKTVLIAAGLTILLAAAVFAQTAADFGVELTDDSSGVRIKGYTGKAAVVRVPATIEGMPVKEIGDRAFRTLDIYDILGANETITSVILPDGLVKIGGEAFCACVNLVSVTIPDSVTEIRVLAFADAGVNGYGSPRHISNSNKLTAVTLPKGLTTAGRYIFAGCKNLKTVTIPEGVAVIGEGMFYNCPALTSITIPNSVKSIGNNAFRYNLTDSEGRDTIGPLVSITLGSGITAIPRNFAAGNGLKTIVIPEGVTEIGGDAFSTCKALTSVTLPSTIKKINARAFAECSALTTVNIPDSVETIDFGNENENAGTFSKCPKLGIAAQVAIKKRGYQGSFN